MYKSIKIQIHENVELVQNTDNSLTHSHTVTPFDAPMKQPF